MSLFAKKIVPPDDPALLEALREFVGAFEIVFQHDWAYTKMIFGDEEEGGTFLRPGLKDEINKRKGTVPLFLRFSKFLQPFSE